MTPKPPRRAVPILVLLALGFVALDLAGAGEAAAQFGFFGAERPLQYRKAYQLRPRYRPQPIVPPVAAEVPLPPPRPHFPGDSPEVAPQAPAARQAPAAAETPAQKPVEVPKGAAPAAEMGPPRPPVDEGRAGKGSTTVNPPAEKPNELVKPGLPTRPSQAPEPAPSQLPKPSVTVGPTPEELPPKGPVAPSGTKNAPSAGAPVSGPPSPPAPTPAPAGPPAAATPPLPPEKPAELKPSTGVAPSGARLGDVPRQPDDDAACAEKLKARNVSVEPTTIAPQKDDRCTIVRPVHLLALTLPDGGKVEFPEHPTIACTTADAFSLYVRDLLAPLAKGTLGSPVAAVWTGPGLECRSRDGIFGAKLSAHGQGLAIDIAQLKLADGRKLEVGQPKDDAGQAFENAARAAACGYFHTVLGPGSDSYHRTHWHFDLIVRGAQGDSKYCK